MSRPDGDTMTYEIERDLAAIDSALAGEAVHGERESIAELALAIRELRSAPHESFAADLDRRAARGFKRERPRRFGRVTRGTAAGSTNRRGGAKQVPLSPRGLALVCAFLLALGIVLPLALSGTPSGSNSVPLAPSHGASREVRQSFGPEGAAESPRARAAGELGSGDASSAGPALPQAAGQGVSGGVQSGGRQVERTAALDIGVATDAIEQTSQRVFSIVNGFHGYVQQSNVSSGDAEQNAGATFELRVPSGSLGSAIAALSQLGRVRSENNTTNDVTGRFESVQRSLGDARAERASLLRQLAAATEQPKVESLKAELRAVEGRISQLQSSLSTLNNRVDYTGVSLSLTPERPAAASPGGLTPGGAAHDAARILDTAVAVVVLASAALLPVAVVVALALLLMAFTRRRLREQALGAKS